MQDRGRGRDSLERYVPNRRSDMKLPEEANFSALGYGHEHIGLWIGLIIVICFVLRLLAYLFLKYRK